MDGYNLPLAIQAVLSEKTINPISSNRTNPVCIGSVGYLAPVAWDPYAGGKDFLNTSASNPLPFDNTTTGNQISAWCPSDLQLNPPDGNSKTRPAFDPCLSACAKYQKSEYCCSGKYGSAKKCGPNYYARAAKSVCPDAYSYAFDDKKSTFTVPTGSGFEIIFCPTGRSTTIQNTLSGSAFQVTSAVGRSILAAVMVAIANVVV